MTDVMLDLETLGVDSYSVITVIAAIKFRRGEKWERDIENIDINKLDTFYRRIDIKSCKDIGLKTSKETENWWKDQDTDIRYEAIDNPDRNCIKEVLIEFKKWLGSYPVKIWGNGSSFDCTILSNAYKKAVIDVPWKFWNERDLRTMLDIGNIKSYNLPEYKKHHALFDCYRQIIGFQMAETNLIN